MDLLGWGLRVLALVLANTLPVHAALREQYGAQQRRDWRGFVTLLAVHMSSLAAIVSGMLIWLELQGYYEYKMAWPLYLSFLGAVLSLLALYLLIVCAVGRFIIRVKWATARRMASRAALANLLALLLDALIVP